MKKLLLSLAVLTAGYANAQNVFAFDFSGTTADMTGAGWVRTNQSTSPSATALWSIANYSVVASVSTTTPASPFQNATIATGQSCPIPLDQAGNPNSFGLVNYASTSSTLAAGATISNWLISPIIVVNNGDVVSFYTRIGKYSATGTASYADNLQLLMSPLGAATVNPTTGPADTGSFTNMLVEINPNLDLTSYPTTWTQYTATISGLTGPTEVEFAFRYYVTDGGTNGSNSDIIGIDSFSVDTPLSTNDFFKNNFTVFPNPVKDILNISNTSNLAIESAKITDVNGRTVKEVRNFETLNQINISELNTGIYFLKVTTSQGTGTTQLIKN